MVLEIINIVLKVIKVIEVIKIIKNVPSRSLAWSPDRVDTDGASSFPEDEEVEDGEVEVTEMDIEAIEVGDRALFTVVVPVVTDTADKVVPDPTSFRARVVVVPEVTDPPLDLRLPKVAVWRTEDPVRSLGDTFPDTRLESEGVFD